MSALLTLATIQFLALEKISGPTIAWFMAAAFVLVVALVYVGVMHPGGSNRCPKCSTKIKSIMLVCPKCKFRLYK